MKHKIFWIAAIAAIVVAHSPLRAAALVWDSFTEGEVDLAPWPGSTRTLSPITSPFVDTRRVTSAGPPSWSVTMEDGVIIYDVSFSPEGTMPRAFWDLVYFNGSGSTFSLLGYDAFVLDIAGVAGSGTVEVYGDGILGRTYPINGPGEMVIPFSELADHPLEDLRYMNFSFVPLTRDFEVRLAGISLVPEPSALLLVFAGGFGLVFRRRRGELSGSPGEAEEGKE